MKLSNPQSGSSYFVDSRELWRFRGVKKPVDGNVIKQRHIGREVASHRKWHPIDSTPEWKKRKGWEIQERQRGGIMLSLVIKVCGLF